MVSINPGVQAYDMRQMYDFVDWRSKQKPELCVPPNTLMGIIQNNPDFTIFTGIVKKARYEGKLSEKQADFTLFVPSDVYLRKKYSEQYLSSIDDGLARQILSFSMMNRTLDQRLLQSSPVSTFPTLDRSNSMLIHTVSNKTQLPNCTGIVHWNHPADNGIIHVIDNLLLPGENVPIWS